MLLTLPAAFAHEIRPAYLELKETAPGQFRVLWRTPVSAGMRLPIGLKLPGAARDLREPVFQNLTDSLIEWRWIDAGPNGLAGQRIEFPGLQLTITDALIRVEMLDGRTWTTLVRPSQPWFEVVRRQSWSTVAGKYCMLGIEHILTGVDHLLFVSGLLMLVSGFKRLVKTISAFTLSHSVTLSLATLGFVYIPPAPVEAVIALSIMFVAYEVLRSRENPLGLAQRRPWLVAFSFGLLHGLGFAGGLSAAGLPAGQVPLALAFFSAGVEVGHFSFVATALLLMAALRRWNVWQPVWGWRVPAYAIGSLSAFWFIQRIVVF
jgi:hypothetical protein